MFSAFTDLTASLISAIERRERFQVQSSDLAKSTGVQIQGPVSREGNFVIIEPGNILNKWVC